MAWRLAKSLETLRAQVNARAPNRSKSSDGTIGDTAHAGRKSDHNPNSRGVVQAMDITYDPKNGVDAAQIAETLRQAKDARIKYVISNARIFSSKSSPWVWRPYGGANAHRQHVHISVDDNPVLYDDTKLWAVPWTTIPDKPPLPKPDPRKTFEALHPVIAKWEGEAYTNHPRDKGGPTKYGITQARLSEARGHQVTAEDVKALSYDEALTIFRRYYWNPLRGDELPPALALMTYNAGVNSGVVKGARFLQQALNRQSAALGEDGVVGARTIKAAAKYDVARAVKDFSAIYEAYYRAHADFDVFGRGWLNRLNDVTPKALALIQSLPPKQPAPEPVIITQPKPSVASNIWDAILDWWRRSRG